MTAAKDRKPVRGRLVRGIGGNGPGIGLPCRSPVALSFSDFAGNPNVYALEVRGDSMIDDHICDGDHILLERVSQASDGDIVVALVAGSETTLKRFYREGADTVRLQPANSSLKPILVPAKDVMIQGRLVAVLRKYK